VARGAWRVARGAWRVARGAWRVARGAWRVARGAWRVARGAKLFKAPNMSRSRSGHAVQSMYPRAGAGAV